MASTLPAAKLFVPTALPGFSLKGAAEWFLQLLSTHKDLDPRGCGRFRQLCRAVLEPKDDVIPSTAPNFPLVLQAEKDLRELRFLWHILQPSPDDGALWQKLQSVIRKGLPLLQSDAPACPARDLQFELFSKAILTRAGMEPTATTKHGDFRCTLGSTEFAVECKRVTSMPSIVDEAGHAASQISKLGLPGLIFMDYSDALSPANHTVITPPGPDPLRAARRARAWRFWRDHGEAVRAAISGKRIPIITYFDYLILHNGLVPGRPNVGNWQFGTIRDSYTLNLANPADRDLGDRANQLIQTLGLEGPVEIDNEPDPPEVIVARKALVALGRYLRDPAARQR